MPSTSQILISAKQLVSDPKNWAVHEFAYDCNGLTVDPAESAACRFCSQGAVLRVINAPAHTRFESINFTIATEYLDIAAGQMFPNIDDVGDAGNSVWVNDMQPHAKVMEMWDLAIALAKKDENAV